MALKQIEAFNLRPSTKGFIGLTPIDGTGKIRTREALVTTCSCIRQQRTGACKSRLPELGSVSW